MNHPWTISTIQRYSPMLSRCDATFHRWQILRWDLYNKHWKDSKSFLSNPFWKGKTIDKVVEDYWCDRFWVWCDNYWTCIPLLSLSARKGYVRASPFMHSLPQMFRRDISRPKKQPRTSIPSHEANWRLLNLICKLEKSSLGSLSKLNISFLLVMRLHINI